MDTNKAIETIERRAFEARLTGLELCARADVHNVSWSRAKNSKRISVKTLRKLEAALDAVERERITMESNNA